MIWKETGVCKDSYMCFFSPPDTFKQHYYYMISCGYFHCNSEYHVKDKGSRPPIFLYLVDGSLELDYESHHYTARADDVVLINCYNPQQYYCTDHCEFLFFHFAGQSTPGLVDYLIHQNKGPVFTLPNASDIYKTIKDPIMRLCYQEQISDAFLSSIVYSALCMMQPNGQSASVTALPYSESTAETIHYINNHITEQLSLKELAEHVNLSPYYFAHLFKKETGYSPVNYVSITKINYAKLMLRTTTISVAEIAVSLGYSSPSSFINAFKAQRGISPQKYRQKNSAFENSTHANP